MANKGEPSVPDWLPDWRDEKAYNFPSQSERILWAWEFLRRNPGYQKAWRENYIEGPLRWVVDRGIYSPQMTGKKRTEIFNEKRKDLAGWIVDPPNSKIRTEEDWRHNADVGHELKYLGTVLAKSFNLRTTDLCDPAIERPKRWQVKFDISFSPSFSFWQEGAQYRGMEPENAEDFIVRFDLRVSLDRQWREIKRLMAPEAQRRAAEGQFIKANENPQLETLKEALRVLDADACSIADSEIAKVLYPNKIGTSGVETVENRRPKALRFRDRDYLILCVPRQKKQKPYS